VVKNSAIPFCVQLQWFPLIGLFASAISVHQSPSVVKNSAIPFCVQLQWFPLIGLLDIPFVPNAINH